MKLSTSFQSDLVHPNELPKKSGKLWYHLLGSTEGLIQTPEYAKEQSQIRKNKTNEKESKKTHI